MTDPIMCPECGHAGHLHYGIKGGGCWGADYCDCIRTHGGIALEHLVELRAAVEALVSDIGGTALQVEALPNEHPADALVRWYHEQEKHHA